ncbi:MAG: hypothetical protein ACI81A_000516 [Paraglaciecola sp.]
MVFLTSLNISAHRSCALNSAIDKASEVPKSKR